MKLKMRANLKMKAKTKTTNNNNNLYREAAHEDSQEMRKLIKAQKRSQNMYIDALKGIPVLTQTVVETPQTQTAVETPQKKLASNDEETVVVEKIKEGRIKIDPVFILFKELLEIELNRAHELGENESERLLAVAAAQLNNYRRLYIRGKINHKDLISAITLMGQDIEELIEQPNPLK